MIKDFKEIIKPRISTMVLLTVWAGSVLTPTDSPGTLVWLHAMIGTLLVAASGSAVNQYIERYSDFLMPRTKNRPLPSGSLTPTTVMTFAAVTLGAGMGYMLLTVSWTSTAICFATWILYGYVYTMTKPKTAWNTAIGAITRLRDMGIEPFLISSSLLGVLAQRLVRTLCPDCKEAYQPDNETKKLFDVEADSELTLYRACGCESCNFKGYRGRTGIYELLIVDEDVQTLIHSEAGEQDIEKHIRRHTPSIRSDGLNKVRQGVTSLEEVLRVTKEG